MFKNNELKCKFLQFNFNNQFENFLKIEIFFLMSQFKPAPGDYQIQSHIHI